MRHILLLLVCVFIYAGEVRLAGPFTDRAVLQHGRPLAVWGWTEPGAAVQVTLGPASAAATAGADGRWLVRLPAQPPGGPHILTARAAGGIARATDVLLGDVWLASGQSNMEWTLGQINQTGKISANPSVRIFVPTAEMSGRPESDLPGAWSVAGPGPLEAHTSAVAAFFAQRLQPEARLPVGVVVAARGGTEIAEWMPPDLWLATAKPKGDVAARFAAVAADPGWGGFRERIVERRRREHAGEKFAKDDRVEPPGNGFKKDVMPGRAHLGFLNPLRDLTCSGILWYQGEYNAGCYGRGADNTVYADYFAALVRTWRSWWGDVPVIAVQLPNYGDASKRSAEPKDGKWLNLQQQQVAALALVPRHALVTTTDVGGAIHPGNKQPVGERLALAALHLAYGRDLSWSGPVATGLKRVGDGVRIAFDHASGLRDADGGDLRGFAVALAQGYQTVPARLDAETVVVGPLPSGATAVVYAWHENPTTDLVNATGIPCRGFRLPLP